MKDKQEISFGLVRRLPNDALQLTIEIGPRLATPSLGPISIAAELCC